MYRVQLDQFTGPLDLLLYLVRRNEVEILDLPIATVTAQFLEYLEVLELISLDDVGDFVATASQLLEIKSRQALPRTDEEPEPLPEPAEDSRGDLIRQLLEYKKYKDAAQALEEQAAEWQERYPRLTDDRPRTGKDPSADLIREVELWDLVSALSRVLKHKAVERHAHIRYDDTPISVYVERIGGRVRTEGRTAFSTLFEETRDRVRIVSMFLAVLELLRHHAFRAEQPHDFGEIWILPPASEAGPDAQHARPDDGG